MPLGVKIKWHFEHIKEKKVSVFILFSIISNFHSVKILNPSCNNINANKCPSLWKNECQGSIWQVKPLIKVRFADSLFVFAMITNLNVAFWWWWDNVLKIKWQYRIKNKAVIAYSLPHEYTQLVHTQCVPIKLIVW